jgi:LysM repeat protein
MSEDSSPAPGKSSRLVSAFAWLVALALVGCAIYLAWQTRFQPKAAPLTEAKSVIAQAAAQVEANTASEPASANLASISLPSIRQGGALQAIPRHLKLHTTIPDRPAEKVRDYTVDTGDSVFGIASEFNIKPETVLWANYDLLNDNPDMISVGMDLKIPPVDGVYYQWQAGDTIESVAARFDAKPEDILNWSENNIDLSDPSIEPGTWILIPGGHREFRQWIIPTIPRGRAGVSKSLYGSGTCGGGYEGAYGFGTFIWPAGNHYLSGNDYWSGHLGIDIAAGEGAPIYAADSGVVVFAGWALGGYGNMVMIDHGNGYQTLYAHLSSVSVSCGRSVAQGNTIGYAGSTGNSTGAHLHFEVRYQGGFVNPWYVLPAP